MGGHGEENKNKTGDYVTDWKKKKKKVVSPSKADFPKGSPSF